VHEWLTMAGPEFVNLILCSKSLSSIERLLILSFSVITIILLCISGGENNSFHFPFPSGMLAHTVVWTSLGRLFWVEGKDFLVVTINLMLTVVIFW